MNLILFLVLIICWYNTWLLLPLWWHTYLKNECFLMIKSILLLWYRTLKQSTHIFGLCMPVRPSRVIVSFWCQVIVRNCWCRILIIKKCVGGLLSVICKWNLRDEYLIDSMCVVNVVFLNIGINIKVNIVGISRIVMEIWTIGLCLVILIAGSNRFICWAKETSDLGQRLPTFLGLRPL